MLVLIDRSPWAWYLAHVAILPSHFVVDFIYFESSNRQPLYHNTIPLRQHNNYVSHPQHYNNSHTPQRYLLHIYQLLRPNCSEASVEPATQRVYSKLTIHQATRVFISTQSQAKHDSPSLILSAVVCVASCYTHRDVASAFVSSSAKCASR